MGSENLFHRRRGTNKDSLQRKAPTKSPSPLYLIVCEGKKTEPHYFNELRNAERISSISIKVCGDCGSAPISVVEHAVALYERSKSENTIIEKVYCVFDKDTHESFYRACATIDRYASEGMPIEAITTTPCFEYWLILHFDFFRAPYQNKGANSVGNAVLKHLQTLYGKYQKGNTNIYSELKDRQEAAISNAKRAQHDSEITGEKNPSTQVHILVEELLKYSAK